MKLIALLCLFSALAFGQALHKFVIIPDGSAPGEIDVRNTSSTDYVKIQSPSIGVIEFTAPDSNAMNLRSVSFGSIAGLQMKSARGTAASPSGLLSGDELGRITAIGYTSAGAYSNAGYAAFQAAENFASTAQGVDFAVDLVTPGTASRSEKWRLYGDGHQKIYGDLLPSANNSWDLGSASLAFANVYPTQVIFPNATGHKTVLYDSGSGAVYGSEIQSTTRRESVDFNTSKISLGYYTSSGGTWNEWANLTDQRGAGFLAAGKLTLNDNQLFTSVIVEGSGIILGTGTFLTAPSGTNGATTTCSGGNVLTNQVVSAGITTGGTCASTGGGGDMLLGTAQTVTADKTFSGAEVKFNAATGEKIRYYDSGSGAVYSTNIQSGARRESVDFNTSKFDLGYYTSGGATWNSFVYANNAGLTVGAGAGNTIAAAGSAWLLSGSSFVPASDNSYDLGQPGVGVQPRWKGTYTYTLDVATGTTAPSGNAGANLTLSCPSTQAIKTLTVSGGFVTGATCGVP